jgi:outer membrane protein OmpA-like peptidoglycan-associated protein
VTAGRLTAKGYGDERPLQPNLTERARARNRRVQMVIREQR